MSKQVFCGAVPIGGGASVTVQSMTNTDTRDVQATQEQIARLVDAGCELARLAVPDAEAAEAFGRIRRQSRIPLIADIHFDYRLAVAAIRQGADKVRINPGNIGGDAGLAAVVTAAKERGIPIRVGVNAGSLDQDILRQFGGPTAAALVESARRMIDRIEALDYDRLVLSIKSSDPRVGFTACCLAAKQFDYPQHIGVTEAGTVRSGVIRSAVGIGALLLAGIGDTIRVSLTGDPVEEVRCGIEILKAAGLRRQGIDLIACPTCGRTFAEFHASIERIEARLTELSEKRIRDGKTPFRAAVMGCAVNGPGEAREADLGIAFGDGRAVLFQSGVLIASGAAAEMVERFLTLAEHFPGSPAGRIVID